MDGSQLSPGLREALLTLRVARAVDALDETLFAERSHLANAEAPDRLSRHVAWLIADAINSLPEQDRAERGAQIVEQLIHGLNSFVAGGRLDDEVLVKPATVLNAVLKLLPDGTPDRIERPLTPLLDTTVLTNAPGEPAVGHELRSEVHSADSIDVVMAFIRFSGIRPLLDVLKRHCDDGKPLRVLTTTYTNSTEPRALEVLTKLGADVRVSYDTSTTRLHAKAWIFHRSGGYSTAYVGSSNLTHSAQIAGLEWNVRLSGVRNADAIGKIEAVFSSYWASRDFVPYEREEFLRRTEIDSHGEALLISPLEVELRPFQQRLLDQLAAARYQGRHKNLLVAATGTGKTVMAAVDYAGLRAVLQRDRLLFVAHRSEILQQSLLTFRQVLREPAFGEKWVAGHRPSRFEHVFASIQSLNASGIHQIDPNHFDVVVIDEFHHAAAPSYDALLSHLKPIEFLGLTATPERSDGVDVLGYFDGRIAAELRVWDAIDQQYLAPFSYYGVHDGLDLRDVPWRRGVGYDVEKLTNVLTADHVWARRVLEQVRRTVTDPRSMRSLGFCVSVRHAEFMAKVFSEAGVSAVSVTGHTDPETRARALQDLESGGTQAVFTVDLFNEGVDVPNVDALLFLRPTDSPTLFLQQLGRGLRKAPGKTECTVLDFVGTHRKEFRFDRRFRALLGGSRGDIERQVRQGFPFLPAGCHMELDPVAQEVVLRSIREAIPSTWRDRCAELKSLGDVSLREYLDETGLELQDIYTGSRNWSDMRREVGLGTEPPGPNESSLLRAVGRMLHVDDVERLDAYESFLRLDAAPDPDALTERERRRLRMLVGSLTSLRQSDSMQQALEEVWANRQLRSELVEVLELLRGRSDHLHLPLDLGGDIPLHVHARYTRAETLAALGVGTGAKPPTWQTGVWWEAKSQTDVFAFTLDKSVGGFSPTTRYRDYAISPELIHWESQGSTSSTGLIGQRYITHREHGTRIILFGRLRSDDRAFWCLGEASYVSHENERPISFVWRLQHPLPADLFSEFAAAVA